MKDEKSHTNFFDRICKNRKFNYILHEIIDQYLISDENIPWIVGFSGGKDSTVLLTFVWMALLKIKKEHDACFLTRSVYVVCNDTLVENPIIANYVDRVLEKIRNTAQKENLPLKVQKTTPSLEDSFFVNLIGRGYPAPNNSFRWCTERLKIRPTTEFVNNLLKNKTNPQNEAIVLIGTRRSESKSRARSIKKHEIKGKRLTKHSTEKNVFVYAPIKELLLEEIWYILNTFLSPWGSDNKILYHIYSDASADDYECPTMVSDKEHTSCGQSRFGCWTCTVVQKDKSIAAQIENGQEWLKPLKDLRDWIQAERNIPENRSKFRRDKTKAIHGMGVVTIKHRSRILQKVLETQKKINILQPDKIELINPQELAAIQIIWHRDLHFNYQVSDIYNKVFNNKDVLKEINMTEKEKRILKREIHSSEIALPILKKKLEDSEKKDIAKKEEQILRFACKNDEKQFTLIQDLLKLEKSKSMMIKRNNLTTQIEEKYQKFIKNIQDDHKRN